MASKWRPLIWAVPLGFVALILVLVWHQDRDFWRSTPALMRLAQDAARRGDYAEAVARPARPGPGNPKMSNMVWNSAGFIWRPGSRNRPWISAASSALRMPSLPRG